MLSLNSAANYEIARIRGQALWDEYALLHENPPNRRTLERLAHLETELDEIRGRGVPIDVRGLRRSHA